MVVYEDLGEVLAYIKAAPGDTVNTVPAGIAHYLQYRLDFDDGDQEIVAGDWLVGATSGAVAKVVSVNGRTVGSWTNETGYFYVDSWNGTAFQDNEEIKVAGQATAANVNGILRPRTGAYSHKGMPAKAATVFVLAQTALFNFGGAQPDQTALIGLPIIANEKYVVRGEANVKTMAWMDYAAANDSTVFIQFHY